MKNRALILGTYNTDYDGLWTLAALQLTDPEYQQHFVEVKGRDGLLDFTGALTDGEPRYTSRTLTATLESSEGTRLERQDRIAYMINALDGLRMNIYHPDHPAHFLTGRVHITVDYNTPAHAAVTVTAVCDPWLYCRMERKYSIIAQPDDKITVRLINNGRRAVVPQVVITGETASFIIERDGVSLTLGQGTYLLPDLQLRQGVTEITCDGTGSADISYREAVLR